MKFSKIRITAKRSKTVGDNLAFDPLVTYEGRALLVDDRTPARVARLIPPAWGTAPERAWRPLVYQAIILGLL